MLATDRDFTQLLMLRKLLQEKKSLPITIVSDSMAPFLAVGSHCTIEPINYDTIQSFDLIVFLAEDRLVCHAVWTKNYLPAANGERTLCTRGLKNADFDYPVRESEILGRVNSHHLSAWQRFSFSLKARFPFLLRKSSSINH